MWPVAIPGLLTGVGTLALAAATAAELRVGQQDRRANYQRERQEQASRIHATVPHLTERLVPASGLTAVHTGAAADAFVGAPRNDPHAPDVIGIAQHGVVYTGGVKKISEHGGDATDDRNVALVVSGAGVQRPGVDRAPVSTTQIAPTILQLLGLSPRKLQGVRADHTKALKLR